MRRVLIWIGSAAALPGYALATAAGLTLAGVPEAAGCVPTRMFAVRCPDTLAGRSLRGLYDFGTIALLMPQLALLPAIYAFGFARFRPMARASSAVEQP